MRSFTATAIQMRSGADKAANLAAAEDMVTAAARQGAALVSLPEVFSWRGKHSEEAAQAEPIPGPAWEAMSRLARKLSIVLVAGSVLETPARSSESAATGEAANGKCFNTCVLFGPDGAQLALYRKIHLFDIDLPGTVTLRESDSRAAGGATVCVSTDLGRIGLAVCYDLRFPELFRRLADDGAEIIVMPSSFTAPTGQAHWHTLVRARAIENQCYFIAPNQYGQALQGFRDYGHSLIVDPWGKVLAEGEADAAGPISAPLDADYLLKVRRELPCLNHRRLRS